MFEALAGCVGFVMKVVLIATILTIVFSIIGVMIGAPGWVVAIGVGWFTLVFVSGTS